MLTCGWTSESTFLLPQPLVLTAVLHSVTNRDSMEAAATLKTSFKVASCGFKVSQVTQKHLERLGPEAPHLQKTHSSHRTGALSWIQLTKRAFIMNMLS